VHLTLHGSGFTTTSFPQESEYCTALASRANCIVIDADYAKSPEHKFPVAFYDIMDIVEFIRSRPKEWDVERLTIGGFSSGGCLALSVAALVPKGHIKAALVTYPNTLMPQPTRPQPPIPKGGCGMPLPVGLRKLFSASYLPTSGPVDLKDPRLSPRFIPASSFPPVTIMCGDCDPLFPDVQDFERHLRDGGVDVEAIHIPGGAHGWDLYVKPGSPFVKLRDDVMETFVQRMTLAWATGIAFPVHIPLEAFSAER